MQKIKLLLTSLSLTGFLALAGCSFPGVYKVDIQQGNVVTQDMIDQLRPGMTQRQVRFIMGNPLVLDTFHPNRWDYLYSIQPGGGQRLQERVSLMFNNEGLLAGLSGDFMPGVSRDEEILGTGTGATVTTPGETEMPAEQQPVPVEPQPAQPDTPPAPGSILEDIQRDVDDTPQITPIEIQDPLEIDQY